MVIVKWIDMRSWDTKRKIGLARRKNLSHLTEGPGPIMIGSDPDSSPMPNGPDDLYCSVTVKMNFIC